MVFFHPNYMNQESEWAFSPKEKNNESLPKMFFPTHTFILHQKRPLINCNRNFQISWLLSISFTHTGMTSLPVRCSRQGVWHRQQIRSPPIHFTSTKFTGVHAPTIVWYMLRTHSIFSLPPRKFATSLTKHKHVLIKNRTKNHYPSNT